MMGLHAFNERRGGFPGKIGIFRIIFEIASAEWGAFDVDRGAKHDRQIVCLRFFSDRIPEGAHQLPVEGAGAQNGRRKADGFDAVVDA